MAIAILIAGSAAACGTSGRRSATEPGSTYPHVLGGEPYATVAWFDPAWRSVVIAGHDCGASVQVEQTPSAVRIGTFSRPTPAGIGVVCAHSRARLVPLTAPLGRRALLGLHGSGLRSLAWRSRLHPGGPWRGMDITAAPPTTATIWTLTFDAHVAGRPGLVSLTSAPAARTIAPGVIARRSAGSVRGHPALKTCPATICWQERGIAYRLAYAVKSGARSVSPAVARRRAGAVASSLVYT